MFERLRLIDQRALLIFLACLVPVVAAGLWLVKKTTGRPMRDLLALLAGGCILVVLVEIALALFPGLKGRQDSHNIAFFVFTALALFVWHIFNRLGKHHRSQKKHHD